jgi:restriction system protein
MPRAIATAISPLAAKYPNGLPDAEVDDIAESGARDYRASLAAADTSGSHAESPAPPIAQSTASPSDLIESALRQIHESVSRDLLELIGHASPAFFEQLVLDLLHAMGYGTSREDLQRVGGSGDGGIDGIISLDKLGLEKVFVQAKRWQNPVGSPQIQTFMGALQLQGASKGVLLTTSTFTKDAKDAAARARGSIVLVDGQRLAALMLAHGVGVTPKRLEIPKIGRDHFFRFLRTNSTQEATFAFARSGRSTQPRRDSR